MGGGTVYQRDVYLALAHQFGKPARELSRAHVHAQAAVDAAHGRLFAVLCRTFRHGVVQRGPVAHKEALEAHALAQQFGVHEVVHRHRFGVVAGVRAHHRSHAGVHRRLEGRQIALYKVAVGKVRIQVVAAGRQCGVAGKVFHAGRYGAEVGERAALEAAYAGGRQRRAQEGVLARCFHDAAPACVIRYVHHRRISQLYACRGGLAGGGTGAACHQGGVPAARLGQGNGTDGAVAVNDILVEHEGYAEAAVLYGLLLQRAVELGAVGLQQRADLSAPDLGAHGRVAAVIIRKQVQLGDFFGKRHAFQQVRHPFLHGYARVLVGESPCCGGYGQ